MLTTPTRPNKGTLPEARSETDTRQLARTRERFPATHEDAVLLQRVSQLRGELRAAADDNAQLQRKLARVRAENRRLRRELAHHPNQSADGEYIRQALTEPWSRNP